MSKIFIISTWREVCGIATYTENLLKGMSIVAPDIEIEIIEIEKRYFSRNYRKLVKDYWKIICDKVDANSIVHIQHEFGLFGDSLSSSNANMLKIIKYLINKNCRIIITIHTVPQAPEQIGMSGLINSRKKFISYLHRRLAWRPLVKIINKYRISLIAHSEFSAAMLALWGIATQLITQIPHGMSSFVEGGVDKNRAKSLLGIDSNKFVVSLFGFVANYKGGDIACKAMSLLSGDYVLLLAGGIHPEATRDSTLNDLIRDYGSANNILFTGYLDSEKLGLVRRATDVFVAPYREVMLSSSGAITAGMSSGAPCITTNIQAFIELNRADAGLTLIGQDQPYLLANAIAAMRNNPVAQRESVKKLKFYSENNSWLNVAKMHTSLYLV